MGGAMIAQPAPLDRVVLKHGFRADAHYPILAINVTNRCNLACSHCFFYRDGNVNEALSPRLEMPDAEMVETLRALRSRHRPYTVLWIGGEPMLRSSLLERAVEIFDFNVIATNGTLPLVDFGSNCDYMISIDGPPRQHDEVRGDGVYGRIMQNLERLPDDFSPLLHAQCTVTNLNQGHLTEMVELLQATRINWVTFSFYVPSADGEIGQGWASLEDRMVAVDEVRRLKTENPDFISNEMAALDLMTPDRAPAVVANCALRTQVLPLFLSDNQFVSGKCPYGENIGCEMCGSNFVYDFAVMPYVAPPSPEDPVLVRD